VNAVATPYGRFNPNPPAGDFIVPRNLGVEPVQTTVSLTLSKTFQQAITIVIDSDNLLNGTRLFDTNGVITSPSFGLANRALNGRRFELGIRYDF
jgi:hypothetical protein